MAYNNEIIKIPASHIRQGYTNDIVISNFIKQVTGDIRQSSMAQSNIIETKFSFFKLAEGKTTYSANEDNYEEITDFDTNGEWENQGTVQDSAGVYYKRLYKKVTFSNKTLFDNLSMSYDYTYIDYISLDASRDNTRQSPFSVTEKEIASSHVYEYGESAFFNELGFAESHIAKFDSAGALLHEVFVDGSAYTTIKGYNNGILCGVVLLDGQNNGTQYDSYNCEIYLFVQYHQLDYSWIFDENITIAANFLSEETVTTVYPEGSESSYSLTLETNELFQDGTTINLEPLFETMASDIINNRQNGLATAEISTAILKYSDINGKVIIDPEASDKEHLFKQGMYVQPWINETTPLAYTNTNEPMNFYVNFADFDFNGVGKQNLKLVEVNDIAETVMYYTVTVVYGTGVNSVTVDGTVVDNGDSIFVIAGRTITVTATYNTDYVANTGTGQYTIDSDTTITVTATYAPLPQNILDNTFTLYQNNSGSYTLNLDNYTFVATNYSINSIRPKQYSDTTWATAIPLTIQSTNRAFTYYTRQINTSDPIDFDSFSIDITKNYVAEGMSGAYQTSDTFNISFANVLNFSLSMPYLDVSDGTVSYSEGAYQFYPESGYEYFNIVFGTYNFTNTNKRYFMMVKGLRPLVDYNTLDNTEITISTADVNGTPISEYTSIEVTSNNATDYIIDFNGTNYDTQTFNGFYWSCPFPFAFEELYILEATCLRNNSESTLAEVSLFTNKTYRVNTSVSVNEFEHNYMEYEAVSVAPYLPYAKFTEVKPSYRSKNMLIGLSKVSDTSVRVQLLLQQWWTESSNMQEIDLTYDMSISAEALS